MPESKPATPDVAPVARPVGRRGLVTVLVVAAVVTVLDQLTKAWALAALDPGVRRPVLGRWLGLQLISNPGAALSIATGMTWVLTVIAVVVVVVVIRTARQLGSRSWALTLGLLLGGAVGNLIDRMVREPGPLRGEVVDFIAYGSWFIGNVADIAIVVAAGLAMVLVARGIRLDGGREGAARADA
ncbi:signal peptidase II [Cellulomonas citrea]|uniref:signal peptidase II n=1 Tax=Cellulomonas citrea TaxID=1909423 RepID=UPI001915D486|nr:signal peptidase II [Cellulomonas citrea]